MLMIKSGSNGIFICALLVTGCYLAGGDGRAWNGDCASSPSKAAKAGWKIDSVQEWIDGDFFETKKSVYDSSVKLLMESTFGRDGALKRVDSMEYDSAGRLAGNKSYEGGIYQGKLIYLYTSGSDTAALIKLTSRGDTFATYRFNYDGNGRLIETAHSQYDYPNIHGPSTSSTRYYHGGDSLVDSTVTTSSADGIVISRSIWTYLGNGMMKIEHQDGDIPPNASIDNIEFECDGKQTGMRRNIAGRLAYVMDWEYNRDGLVVKRSYKGASTNFESQYFWSKAGVIPP